MKDKIEQVIVYIDGFNLYFGMMDANCADCRWLDVQKLAESLIRQNQKLVTVKYFTSRVRNHPSKEKRQSTYLDALQAKGIDIRYGHYQAGTIECRNCYHIWPTANEKMTDVNIATELIIDAYKNKYDTAILISGDSDLTPPLRAVHSEFPNKRIVVAFPPKRHSVSLKKASKGNFIIGRKKLKDAQLDEKIPLKSGFILHKPNHWKSKN
jgi:uncharacterized LabA/DUF88 family protein